jgi:phytoene dehydrogenase-like protein
MADANVIGSGPNGLAAAIVLAQAGVRVDVFEAQAQPGGAVRTMELTLPGFRHDFGSAVFPFGVGSPFFHGLGLGARGLEWVHGDAPLAHPLDDGTAVVLERDFEEAQTALGVDGRAWRRLLTPVVKDWFGFAGDALAPVVHVPRHPLRMARFGLGALVPVQALATTAFQSERTRALLAGLAAHSVLSFDHPLTGATALLFAGAAHTVGWPIARGGAQSITDALIAELRDAGGAVHTSHPVASLDELDTHGALDMCDVTPRQLVAMAGKRLRPAFRQTLERFEYGPGTFKVDFALSEPVPWRAAACRRAPTVHVGGSFEEIAASEYAMSHGQHAERPFVLTSQPSLFDATRAPEGKHVLWAYCHVPSGSTVDMTERIEAQIERFAPGFRDCILAKHVSTSAWLERMDANLVGGHLNGGNFTMRQFVFRPGVRQYATGTRGLYLCSSSTPPGGGVHGMCGYHAAQAALRYLRREDLL